MLDEARDMLRNGTRLTEKVAYNAFSEIMAGQAYTDRIADLLALLARGAVTVDELTGAARVMREHVKPVPVSEEVRATLIDTCGTGGAPKTFNVSTAAALIVAGAGRSMARPVRVAKHGNRSRTGRGSAEVLMELGVHADASPEVQARCVEEAGLCFSFAIHHHPAIKHAMPARKSLDHPTIFNLLGPMTNPAGARVQLIGTFDRGSMGTMAEALRRLGSASGMICHGDDGLDELTTTTTSACARYDAEAVHTETIDPASLGLARASLGELGVGSVEESAAVIGAILDGEAGPKADIALLNAGAALWVGGASGDLAGGVELGREALRSGAARGALADLVRVSRG